MRRFRITIRHGQRPFQYHVDDVEADSLRAALESLLERLPDEVNRTADLLEARLHAEDEQREYAPG